MLLNEELCRKHFPYEKPNPGQMESIQDAAAAVSIGRVKHIIIEAPTGIGKSAIAYTIHKINQEVMGKFRTTIITSTKGLQDQYKSHFKEIDNLMGKTNYTCPHGVGPYNSLDCMKKKKNGCLPDKECPYFMTRQHWCNVSQLRMTNHSFQIEACPQICMEDDNKADMIVIDECHELEMNIINHSIVKLSMSDFNSSVMMQSFKNIRNMVQDAIRMITTKENDVFVSTEDQRLAFCKIQSEAHDVADELMQKALDSTNPALANFYTELVNELHTIEDRANLFASTYNGSWLVTKREKDVTIELKPVYASQVADFCLFRKAKYFIHMSSTICGVESYKKSLGIKDKECFYINIDNPIPLENRKIKVYPNFKVSGGFSDYKGLAEDIDHICNHHKDESGIIHTVSFDLANKILNNSKSKNRMIISNDRREILRHLSTRNGIVLSPSIEKGFDAKDDLSRFQILPKVPYAYLGDPLISYNSKAKGDWYARSAILRIVQACGRSIRGVDDYASTYILDSNFLRLLKENEYLFPRWFIDSLEIN